MHRVTITKAPLDVASLRESVPAHPCCGAWVQFEGVVRTENGNRPVVAIEYECFQEMAERELEQIIDEAQKRWPVHEVRLAHRIGRVPAHEVSLLVLVTSPHRGDAFQAAQYIIDELKKRVPIWKKEFYDGGNAQWLR